MTTPPEQERPTTQERRDKITAARSLREAAVHAMDLLDRVEWDRWSETNDGDDGRQIVFGWVDPGDDFVVLQWERGNPWPAIITSSAKASAGLSRQLYGTDGDHRPCRPIAELRALGEQPT